MIMGILAHSYAQRLAQRQAAKPSCNATPKSSKVNVAVCIVDYCSTVVDEGLNI